LFCPLYRLISEEKLVAPYIRVHTRAADIVIHTR
jgi:hypothetical protein